MSKISNTEKLKTMRLHTPRTVAVSMLLAGVFLSVSHMSNADDQQLKASVNARLAGTSQPLFKPPFDLLQRKFIKDIRAAIASKWKASQLHNLIEVIVSHGQSPEHNLPAPIPSNSFKPLIGQTLTYDSNYLRIADSNNSGIALERGKSEFIKQIRAGIAAKWTIKRQVLLVKALIVQNWYSTYTELDYLGRDIQVNWNWQLSKYLTGDIGYANQVIRGSYSQLNNLVNNLQTNSQYFVNGEYQFSPSWFIQGGGAYHTSKNPSGILASNDLEETIGIVGIKYLTPTLNQLGLKSTYTGGNFPNRHFSLGNTSDNAYTRYDFNFEWAWQYSVKTRFDGHIGYAQQTSEHLPARNFSGPTARANANWLVTDKTTLTFTGWREIQLSYAVNASFVLSEGLRITPTWLATPKLQFKLPMSYETQSYLGDPGFTNNQASNAEQDKISLIGLMAEYTPFTNSKIGLFIQHEGRSSNNLSRNYQSNAVGLDMQLSF